GGEIFWREQLFLSNEYSQRMAGGALWLRRPINDTTRLQLEYRFQEIQIFDLDDGTFIDLDGDGTAETLVPGTSPEIAAEEGTFIESKMTLELLQDTRDSNTLPRTGHRLSLATSLSGGFFGGDVDTYNLSGSFTQHVSLPFDTIFTFHIEGNIADTWGDGDRVPIFNRHFLGGAYNLRGFEYRDVGPVDSEDEALGGGTSAFTTVEYSVPVMDRLRVHSFLDAGFVNADAYDFSSTELNADVGLGIRLEVPGFGPMRLDYGIPIKRSEHQGNGGRINFLLDFRY
ncbi:MAG: BamA/TamA family outer membrane protein, partial [Verrucomicrobiales bacterium]